LSFTFFRDRPGAFGSALVLLFMMAGCSMPQALQKAGPSVKACNVQEPEDLARFPQTIEPYLVNVRERSVLSAVQRHYKEAYYSVWAPEYVPETAAEVRWPFDVYTPEDAYGENLRPLPQSWFDAMLQEANWGRYGSVGKAAISLARLELRNFPTSKPLFHNPCEAGEGFPFDYLQNSSVFADEPLYLSHYSRSGAWAYVLTSYATGWVPSDKIALIDTRKRRAWQARPLLALLGEQMPMHTEKGDYLFKGDTGMLLPLYSTAVDGFFADAVIVQGVRKARVIRTPVPNASAAVAPMVFSRGNLGRVIDTVMQTKYGWGGRFGDRDCSSTLRDVFAPFGLWLPRNSYQQSNVGRVVSFEGMDDGEKLSKIKAEARPFETLLYLKGHILLYLGLYNGEPAVLHTIWGIKTVEGNGEFGRYIVGKTVISSLRFGRELEGYSEKYSLLHRIESMNFIFEEGSQE
jgi:hypothetical protein